MKNEKSNPDTSQLVRNLSEIKDPETYFETVRKLMTCPGSSFALM